jgi:hypothetical protein
MHLSKNVGRQPNQDGYRYSYYQNYFAPGEHNFAHLTLKRTPRVGTGEKERDEMVICVTEVIESVAESAGTILRSGQHS